MRSVCTHTYLTFNYDVLLITTHEQWKMMEINLCVFKYGYEEHLVKGLEIPLMDNWKSIMSSSQNRQVYFGHYRVIE